MACNGEQKAVAKATIEEYICDDLKTKKGEIEGYRVVRLERQRYSIAST